MELSVLYQLQPGVWLQLTDLLSDTLQLHYNRQVSDAVVGGCSHRDSAVLSFLSLGAGKPELGTLHSASDCALQTWDICRRQHREDSDIQPLH